MIDQDIEINQEVVERLQKLYEKKCLAHAYLFVGPAYSGKGQTALAIARLLVAASEKQTQKELSKDHPDIYVIESGFGETIKIEDVRQLLERVKLRPFSADIKVFIMQNVENLTVEGANAFLKTLEEPSNNSLLLLTTSVPERVLETIKSRCHAIYFLTSSPMRLAQQLQSKHGMNEADAHYLAYFAEGCQGRSQKLFKEDFISTKNRLLDQFLSSHQADAFIKEIVKDKNKVKQLLDILLSWLRDSMLIKAGVEDRRLIHVDRLKELRSFQSRFHFQELKILYEEVVRATQLLTDNLNVRMTLTIIKEKFHG